MEPRISLITLGVADLGRARAFYEALGWRASGASMPDVVFFHGNGLALALYGRGALAADALAAGAIPLKNPHDTSWGGYSGYFADPDGHLWEVAWNPFFPLDADGNLHLPA